MLGLEGLLVAVALVFGDFRLVACDALLFGFLLLLHLLLLHPLALVARLPSLLLLTYLSSVLLLVFL